MKLNGESQFMGIGLALGYWIHSVDPGDNTLAGALITSVLFCPGAILLGRAIWPPSRK